MTGRLRCVLAGSVLAAAVVATYLLTYRVWNALAGLHVGRSEPSSLESSPFTFRVIGWLVVTALGSVVATGLIVACLGKAARPRWWLYLLLAAGAISTAYWIASYRAMPQDVEQWQTIDAARRAGQPSILWVILATGLASVGLLPRRRVG